MFESFIQLSKLIKQSTALLQSSDVISVAVSARKRRLPRTDQNLLTTKPGVITQLN